MAWTTPTYEDALFAELPANEQARERSYFHPALVLFHKVRPAPDFQEWERIGITADALPLPEGKSVEERVAELFPEITPSDPRLVHEIKRLSTGSPHVHIRCGACRTWAGPTEMIDVRSHPETAEHPILDRRNREHIVGPPVTVLDNDATVRNTDRLDPDFGKIIGPEVPKLFQFVNSRPSVVGYEPPVDLKNGAGFVCSGCWTRWIRSRYKIDGVTYTKLHHITLLGAPQDTIDEHKDRPGWNTPGMTAY